MNWNNQGIRLFLLFWTDYTGCVRVFIFSLERKHLLSQFEIPQTTWLHWNAYLCHVLQHWITIHCFLDTWRTEQGEPIDLAVLIMLSYQIFHKWLTGIHYFTVCSIHFHLGALRATFITVSFEWFRVVARFMRTLLRS